MCTGASVGYKVGVRSPCCSAKPKASLSLHKSPNLTIVPRAHVTGPLVPNIVTQKALLTLQLLWSLLFFQLLSMPLAPGPLQIRFPLSNKTPSPPQMSAALPSLKSTLECCHFLDHSP